MSIFKGPTSKIPYNDVNIIYIKKNLITINEKFQNLFESKIFTYRSGLRYGS